MDQCNKKIFETCVEDLEMALDHLVNDQIIDCAFCLGIVCGTLHERIQILKTTIDNNQLHAS